jgi:hypothetical protein
VGLAAAPAGQECVSNVPIPVVIEWGEAVIHWRAEIGAKDL